MSFKIKYIDLNSQHKPIVKEINKVVSKVFKNSAFILRQNVQQFEKKVCKILKVKYCVAVNSGTDALLFALSQLNLKKTMKSLPHHTHMLHQFQQFVMLAPNQFLWI